MNAREAASTLKVDADIASLDLECIAYRVCRTEKWPIEKVDNAELQYRGFLQLIRNCGPKSSVAPTGLIDTFWHHHILDTEKYMRDCEALFGRYIHHFPYSGIFGDEDMAAQKAHVSRTTSMISEILSTSPIQKECTNAP